MSCTSVKRCPDWLIEILVTVFYTKRKIELNGQLRYYKEMNTIPHETM